jgi:hypothetical protein
MGNPAAAAAGRRAIERLARGAAAIRYRHAKAADIIYGKGKVMKPILDSLSAAKGAPPADASGAAPADQEPGEAPDSEQGPGEGAQDKGNPAVLALANTAVQIVSKLDASAKEAGQPIPDDVLYHAGSEIVGMLAEVAEAANIHDYSDDEIQGAFYQAVDQYRPIAEEMGRTDDATLKSQFGQILDADAQGQLGQVLPGTVDHWDVTSDGKMVAFNKQGKVLAASSHPGSFNPSNQPKNEDDGDGSISGQRAARNGKPAPAAAEPAPSKAPSPGSSNIKAQALANLGNVYMEISGHPEKAQQYRLQYPGMFDANGKLLPKDSLIERINQRYGG